MPVHDLTRCRGVLAGAALVAVAGAVALLGPGGNGPSASGPGPTVAAERRDLVTSLTAAGEVRRSAETVVAHVAPVGPGSGGEGGGGGGSDPSALRSPGPAGAPGSTLSTGSSTSSTSAMATSTASSATSSTTTSTTSSTVPAPSTTTSTSVVATTSLPTTTSTSAPPAPVPPTPPSSPTSPGPGEGGPGSGGATGGGSPGGGQAGGGEGGGGRGGSSGSTLTGVAAVGSRADRGTVLYRADEQPVVALLGAVPAWRSLAVGVDDGVDVRQLEANLVALGHGAGVTVDDTFTAATAAAVEAWETALGRARPDGEVALGDVAYLAAPGDVLSHRAAVGDTLGVGTPVLALGTEQRQLVAPVDATGAGGWVPGAPVQVEWADATRSDATVVGAGREVTDGRVELVVALGEADRGRRNGAAATVTLVDARRDGVVAVPVAALVDDDGSPAVRVADGPDPDDDRVVPVTTGLVAGAWVEVTSGLDAGEEVRLPG